MSGRGAERQNLSVNMESLHAKNSELMQLLGITDERMLLAKIVELIKDQKKSQQFYDCLRDIMQQCIPREEVQSMHIDQKEMWRWIKGLVENFYRLKKSSQILSHQNDQLNSLVRKLNEAIQEGLVIDSKNLESTLNQITLYEYKEQ